MLDKGYGILPNKVLFDKELSDKQKLLFCLISSLCAEKGFCWAKNSFLAEKLGSTTRTIREHITTLQEKGYIIIEMKNNNERSIKLSDREEENFLGGGKKLPRGEEENFHPYIYMNITNEYISQNFYGVSKYGVDEKKCNKLINDKLKQGITLNDIRVGMVLYNNECRLRGDWEHLMKLETWLERFQKPTEEQIEERLTSLIKQHKQRKKSDEKYSKSARAKTLWKELCETFGKDKVNTIFKSESTGGIELNFI